MPRRRTPRLAYSEYVSPDLGDSTQVWMARRELIETAKRVYPRFVKTLLAEGLLPYRDLANTRCDIESILVTSPFKLLPEDSDLKLALLNWATAFNIGWQSASEESAEMWLMDEALRALRNWNNFPDWRDVLRWSTVHPSPTVARGDHLEFHFMGWEMQMVTWAKYSEMAHAWFETKLANYQKEARELAQSCGLILAQKKYSPDNFEWFVLYQLAGLSSTEIADRWSKKHDSGTEPNSVLKGIKAAAKLVGWDHLRPTRTKGKQEN